MPRYPHPKDVSGLEEVAGALKRAERIKAEGPPFELCVCDAQGRVVAAMTIQGFDAVKMFSRAMARLGYAADIIGDSPTRCDVLYTKAEHVRDIFDDGQPITGPAPLD